MAALWDRYALCQWSQAFFTSLSGPTQMSYNTIWCDIASIHMISHTATGTVNSRKAKAVKSKCCVTYNIVSVLGELHVWLKHPQSWIGYTRHAMYTWLQLTLTWIVSFKCRNQSTHCGFGAIAFPPPHNLSPFWLVPSLVSASPITTHIAILAIALHSTACIW